MRPIVIVGMLAATALAAPGDADWKRQVEAKANADLDEHQRLVKAIGKPVKIVFDWSTYATADWSRSDPEFVAGRCLYEPADVIRRVAENAELEAGLARLATITCRPATYKQTGGVAVYKLVDGGTRLDVAYCENCSNGKLDEVLQDGLKGAGGESSGEAAWRKHTETYANNQAQDSGENQSKGAHELVQQGCGHDVALTFDWKTLAMKDWFKRGDPNLHTQTLEWAGTEVLKNMGRLCATPKLKKKLAKVKTVAVHGGKNQPLRQRGATGDEPGPKFKLKGGTLEVWFAPGVQLRDEYLEAQLK